MRWKLSTYISILQAGQFVFKIPFSPEVSINKCTILSSSFRVNYFFGCVLCFTTMETPVYMSTKHTQSEGTLFKPYPTAPRKKI